MTGVEPATAVPVQTNDDARYILGWIEVVRDCCRALVNVRQTHDADPDDKFRGLYVSDEQVWAYLADQPPNPASGADLANLAELDAWADAVCASGSSLRMREVASRFSLEALDVSVLMVAMAPDLDPRLEKVYGYLHDDVTRRRASVGLALELWGADPLHPGARARFGPLAPLVAGRLLHIEEPDRPFLTRSLRVPDEVVAYLLGDDTLDAVVAAVHGHAATNTTGQAAVLCRGLRAGAQLVYVRDRVGAAALSFAVTGVQQAGLPALVIDLDRVDLADGGALAEAASAARRRARLDGGVLVAGPVDALTERGPAAMRTVTESDTPTVLIGSVGWDPVWSRRVPLLLEAPELTSRLASDLPFRLTPEQAERARAAADLQAAANDVAVDSELLAAGARAQNAGGLERLALRVSPAASWDDLVLPPAVLEQLHELAARVRYRDVVLDEWDMRRGSARGRGVTALFAGDSGTGKTLSAEVVAHALRLDLYVVDLATVVDKYIGETEKNLDRIFREADRVNGVLLFDEADAIFGKRSEVQDARDRYANVEVAYLLQRMERFDGIAILTTNLRANLDDAFLRRLDALVDFPVPDEQMRLLLWERHLPRTVPRAPDVNVPFLAGAFDLSGGNIRNITMAAAFLAAAESSDVTMSTLIRATAREYRKLGRLCVEAEFGPYHNLLARSGGNHVDVR